MLKFLAITLATAVLAWGCDGPEAGKKDPAAAAPATAEPTPVPDPRGLALMKSSDCLTCHQPDRKLVGPSFAQMARKYQPDEATVAGLVEKVKKGGSGNWGEIAMTPHPGLSDSDARAMVEWILEQ